MYERAKTVTMGTAISALLKTSWQVLCELMTYEHLYVSMSVTLPVHADYTELPSSSLLASVALTLLFLSAALLVCPLALAVVCATVPAVLALKNSVMPCSRSLLCTRGMKLDSGLLF